MILNNQGNALRIYGVIAKKEEFLPSFMGNLFLSIQELFDGNFFTEEQKREILSLSIKDENEVELAERLASTEVEVSVLSTEELRCLIKKTTQEMEEEFLLLENCRIHLLGLKGEDEEMFRASIRVSTDIDVFFVESTSLFQSKIEAIKKAKEIYLKLCTEESQSRLYFPQYHDIAENKKWFKRREPADIRD